MILLLKSYSLLAAAVLLATLPKNPTSLAMEPAGLLLIGTGLLGSIRFLRKTVQLVDLVEETQATQQPHD